MAANDKKISELPQATTVTTNDFFVIVDPDQAEAQRTRYILADDLVTGLVGLGINAVDSVFGRTGSVVSANGDYTASQITNVPAGSIAATTVQAAINELDTEKISNLSTFDTDDLTEGATNLYSQWQRSGGRISPQTITDTLHVGNVATPTAPLSGELGVFEGDGGAFFDVIAHSGLAAVALIVTGGDSTTPTATTVGLPTGVWVTGYGDTGYVSNTLPGITMEISDTWTDTTEPTNIYLGAFSTSILPLSITLDNGTTDGDLYLNTENGQVAHTDYSADRIYFGNADQAFFNVSGELTVPDEAYGAGWNGDLTVPTKNALYDKLSALTITDITGITASAAEINVLDGIPVGLTATELGYVDGVTSAIQTQINTKVTGPASATDNAIMRFDGTTGKLAQNSGWTMDDSNVMTTTGGGVVVNGSTGGQFLSGNVFGYAGAVIYNTAGDANVAFGFLPAGVMSFLGYPSAGMVSGAGGASSIDTAMVRSAAGEWTFYGASGSVLGNLVTSRLRANAGTPESVVTAGVGAISHDTTNGVLYVKATGTGNTGWVSLQRAASDTVTGWVELATIAEISTGTDATRSVTPDGLAGSIFGTKTASIQVIDAATAVTTGDGKAYFRIPSSLNGMDLVGVAAEVNTTSSSGNPTVQIARGRQANATSAHSYVDTLSTAITIDATEYDSKDATTAAVINTSNDDVATGDIIRVDVDVAGTGTAGLLVSLQFRIP